MHQAFGTVIWVVCIVAGIFAVIALMLSGRTWAEHGKGGMVMDHDASARPGARASVRERDAEIRELIRARNARRIRRGEAPLDEEAEFARLTAPTAGPVDPSPGLAGRSPAPVPMDATEAGHDAPGVHRPEEAVPEEFSRIDPELREEVRQLVVARNHRRVRAGKPPLDVEAEVLRELRKVSQL